jgi:outer membrane receptor for ferrienterochelin and colicins
MANLKLQYDHQNFFANTRALYRSRWATTDTDGNGIFNTNDAFAKGFIQLNMAVGQGFNNGLSVQTGIDNLLNYTDVLNLPNLPGRTIYLSVSYNFLNKNPK